MIESGNLDHARLVAKEAGCFFNPECDIIVSRTENGKLLGGVIFTGFKVASIGLHCAGFDPCWINKDLLWFTFHYPFEQLSVRKIVTTIPSRNLKAIKFNRKLGFAEETRVADVFPDGDLIIMSMLKNDCRWLERGHRGR